MSDMLIAEGLPVAGIQRYVRYRDMGDGSWAPVVVAETAAAGGDIASVVLINAVTAPTIGAAFPPPHRNVTFQAYGSTTAGAGSATVKVQASNVASPGANDWLDLGTITLTLSTTRINDGFAIDAPWASVRGNVTAISGTNATVTLLMGG